MDLQQLTNDIKERARALGFQKVGIAPADQLAEESGKLRGWLALGYHGTMSWMERNFEKRADPRAVLPGARSIISIAMNYYSGTEHSKDEHAGKISRYAWGDDYHAVVEERLSDLLDYIRERRPDARGMVYVDTGPIMEKAWAQRSGIGWQGKHTNIITQEYGSWVFLGEILVDFELTYDTPAIDHCGSCTLCIEACPTQAITEPYVIDSTLCISYLTIEHRGAIAEKLGERFDRWIYGCDICQDVCPWNIKFSQETSEKAFQARPENTVPLLDQVAAMTVEEFQLRFKKSPVKRTKCDGLRRNAELILKTQSTHTDQEESWRITTK